MEFFKLEKINFPLFEEIDPFAMLKEDFPEERFAMGLFARYQGYDYPVGLAICTETPDSLIIEWMMVASLARERGMGSFMISKLIQLANQFNKPKLQAIFPYNPVREILCQGEKIFFKQHGFMSDGDLDGISCMTLSEEYFYFGEDDGSMNDFKSPYKLEDMIKDTSDLFETEPESFDSLDYDCFTLEALGKSKLTLVIDEDQISSVETLADLDIQELTEVLSQAMTSRPKGIMIVDETDFDISKIDLDISCVIRKNDKLEALIFVAYAGDDTLVIRKFSVSKNLNRVTIAYLLKCAYLKASELFDGSCKLYINNNSENSRAFIDALHNRERTA